MPIYKTGNMWTVWNDVDRFLITTNSTIKNNGELVMGRGIAREAKQGIPDVATQAAVAICSTLGVPHTPGVKGQYGVILGPKIGLFQVKFGYRDRALLELIEKSTRSLLGWAVDHPEEAIALNFPGIGNGERTVAEVKPIIDILPDNVQIWSLTNV